MNDLIVAFFLACCAATLIYVAFMGPITFLPGREGRAKVAKTTSPIPVGPSAGWSNMSFGYNALVGTTTGYNNTCLQPKSHALANLTNGVSNVVLLESRAVDGALVRRPRTVDAPPKVPKE